MSVSNVSAPSTSYYDNGQKQFEFTPNGLGGQAGTYQYFDQNGKLFLSELKSSDGHVGFERDANQNGTTYSTTVAPPRGEPRTVVFGAQ
jgi:hypothetical protein